MSGHLDLMRQRRAVDEVIVDTATTETVRRQLATAQRILDFAHAELGLPDNGSYRSYADIRRDFVVWNVFAAGEFSLRLKNWCFPVAGCVSYRGYFRREDAERYAAALDRKGFDTFVGGVAAYSTLGRFRDPLLSNMVDLDGYRLAALLIHELAHQKYYVRGDSAFNESFASFVEQQGVMQWLQGRQDAEAACAYRRLLDRRAKVGRLFDDARVRLERLYASDLPAPEMRARKGQAFMNLARDYGRLRTEWREPPYFDAWFDGSANNARLGALATYDKYVPAFRALFAAAGRSWPEFFARAAELGALDSAQRETRLRALHDAANESAAEDRGYPGECRESKGSDPSPLSAALRRF